jgi:predicted RNA binding protein YcfA (HicA-like mRNA interferase family)
MRPFEVHKMLERNGFTFHREGGKHAIYKYGDRKITIPRGRTIKYTTSRIIEKFVRETVAMNKGNLAVVGKNEFTDNDLDIPISACDELAGEANYTSLPPSHYQVFRDFLLVCEEKSDQAGELNIRDILIQNGYQLADWNSLVATARENQDISVLFDLQDAVDAMKIPSHSLKIAIAEIEKNTAPVEREVPSMKQDPQEDYQAARVISQGDRLIRPLAEPLPPRPRMPPIPPVQRDGGENSYDRNYEQVYEQPVPTPAPVPPPPPSQFSPKQQLHMDMIAVIGKSRLTIAEAREVADKVLAFLDMG